MSPSLMRTTFTTRAFVHTFFEYILNNDLTAVFVLGRVSRGWRTATALARAELRTFRDFEYLLFDGLYRGCLHRANFSVLLTAALPLLVTNDRYRAIVQQQRCSWRKQTTRLVYMAGYRRTLRTISLLRFATTLSIVKPNIRILCAFNNVRERRQAREFLNCIYRNVARNAIDCSINCAQKRPIQCITRSSLVQTRWLHYDILFADNVYCDQAYYSYLEKCPRTIGVAITTIDNADRTEHTIPHQAFKIVCTIDNQNESEWSIEVLS